MTNQETVTQEISLIPLSEQQREAYPNIVYQESSQVADSRTILVATINALDQAGFTVVADLDFDKESGARTAVVRTAAKEIWEHRTESALIHGVSCAIDLKLEEQRTVGAEQPDVAEFAKVAADTLVGQVTTNTGLYDAFRNYYGGLRWSTDQGKFVAALLTESVAFDPEQVERNLTGSDIVHLVHALDQEVPYDRYKNWYDMKPVDVFKEIPELDYHKLEDDDFKRTTEGQKLQEEYRRILGSKLADQYTRYPREVTDDGIVIQKPIIPLTQFPVIEALMADHASTSKPRAKYDFGASEVDEIIVQSDSVIAQRALVESVTTRLPKQDRHIFDGPDEFQHKTGDISSLMHGYRKAYGDETRQTQFRDYILTVLKAYSDDGDIARDVRTNWHEQVASGRDWISTKDVDDVKRIVSDIMTIGLASPDAEAFVATYMPDFERGLATEVDPLALNPNDLKFMILNALGHISEHSQALVIERVGTKIFQDDSIGRIFREVAELRIKASQMLDDPQIHLARKEFGRHYTDGPEKDQARQTLDDLTAPAEVIRAEARDKLNKMVIDYLNEMVSAGQLAGQRDETSILFDGLVKQIYVGDAFLMKNLPAIYDDLIKLAERPELPDGQKAQILWHFARRFEYGGEEVAKLLVPVVLDIYRIMLGPMGSLRLPTEETDHGLDAANFLVRNNRVFKNASEDELLTLSRYKGELASLIKRINTGLLTPADVIDSNDEEIGSWQEKHLQNIAEVVRTMSILEGHYEEYLHLEDVKLNPHVYYPWLIEKLTPFWHKMQWEVNPGNRPQQNIRNLYDVLKDHIDHKLVFKKGEYPEDFDAIKEGHVDTLLIECYERMMLDHDIKYNTTVWQDGITFMHYAVAMMPPKLLDQIRAARAGEPRYVEFIEYVEREHERWNKDEEES